MDRVRDRVRVRGLAIAAHSYSGPNRFQWGRKLEFAPVRDGLIIALTLKSSRNIRGKPLIIIL